MVTSSLIITSSLHTNTPMGQDLGGLYGQVLQVPLYTTGFNGEDCSWVNTEIGLCKVSNKDGPNI